MFKYSRIFLSIILLLISLNLSAQKNSDIWNALLENNRQQALEIVNKLKLENDIENLMLKKIVEMENGIMQCNPNSIYDMTSYPDYENYLFSNWMMPYIFNDYLENGFEVNNYEAPNVIDASKINNSTVKNGLYYLQAITKRHQRKKNQYTNLINKIDVIGNWEFCGVFENLNSSGIEMPYPPEEEVSSNVIFDAQSKGDARWYNSVDTNEAYKFFSNHSEFGSGVHYAQTFIISPKDQRIQLKLGKGGLIRLWINDVLIIEDDNQFITELDAYTYKINLHEGVNRILVKTATSGSTPYFIVRLEDLKGNSFDNYSISFDDRKYKKGSVESVNPEFVPHKIETYFENKIKENIDDINLSKFCLYLSYSRNGRLDKALKLLKSWSEDYPNSSLIKSCLIECYNTMGEENLSSKIQNNVKRLDPEYYLSYLLELENFDELMKLDIDSYNSKLNKIGNSVDYSYMKNTVDFFMYLRQVDREKMLLKLDELLNDKTLPSSVKPIFSEFYSTVFNDDDATIKILEKFNSTEFHSQVEEYLAYYYKKQNRIEDALQIYLSSLDWFGHDNNILFSLISILHDTGQYQRSLPYIEMALKNYPTSYSFTKFKGDAYVQLKKEKEAIKLYETALKRDPSNNTLRTKINDLKNYKNPLNEFHLEDAYSYIQENRNTISTNNYGLNTLLNQTDILAYKDGGGEYKSTFIYEITSQNGVNIFKEYNLGLSGDYTIYKSEIVKPNEDTVPADRNGSKLVFDELEIGDVVYIDYEVRYSRYGRFYKDYILKHNFNGYHPTIKNVYRFLTNDKEVNHVIINNKNVDYKKYKNDDLFVHEWSFNNSKGLPIQEDYMPTFNDITTKLHISSIKSWNDIAVWYSDLVRKQLKNDQVVKETFKEIFSDDYKQLSEKERAKRIYYYITNNLNYSSINFRQSGYVPQKPSKTINSKLGDCKDFSSLYQVLAKQAELDVRLVLIKTSSHGKKDLILPSTDFNHCIVKVNIDDTDQYLELTDKHLPFKALPMSLRGATALEIPYDVSEGFKSDLTYLENAVRDEALFESDYVIDVSDENSKIELTTSISGHMASYYIETFQKEKDKLLEESIIEEISGRASHNVELLDLVSHNHDIEKGAVIFTTRLSTDLNINKLGELYAFKIPYFLNPYNNSIIQEDKRAYPIDYKKYENTDSYKEGMTIRLEENQKFIDIPKNIDLKFSNHHFSIQYILVNSNELKMTISSRVNSENITVDDYPDFKEYVKDVLDTRKTLITFQ